MTEIPVELWRSRVSSDRDQRYADQVSAWLREHDLDPAQVRPEIVVTRLAGQNWLHVSEYVRGERGERRMVDRALQTAVSLPRVVPLRSMPPVPSACLDPGGGASP